MWCGLTLPLNLYQEFKTSFFSVINMCRWTHTSTKCYGIFTKSSDKEKVPLTSNPISKPEYSYLSGSAFLVYLTAPNKGLFSVKSELYSIILYYIIFSTFSIFVLRTVAVTKPPVSGILFSASLIFVLRTAVVTKPLTSAIFL